jgi:hypothetical protein
MAVAVKAFCVKVSCVHLDGLFKDPSKEELHYLGENIFALVHDFELLTAKK